MATILTVTASPGTAHIDMAALADDQLSRGRWRVRANPDACETCTQNAQSTTPKMPELHKHCRCEPYWEELD